MIDLNKLKPRDIIKFYNSKDTYIGMFNEMKVEFGRCYWIKIFNLVWINHDKPVYYTGTSISNSWNFDKPSKEELKKYTRCIKNYRMSQHKQCSLNR